MVTPGGNPVCKRCGNWYGPGVEHECPWSDPGKPGRLGTDGNEWWACDPYPTWFRWEGEPGDKKLRTKPMRVKWRDEQ